MAERTSVSQVMQVGVESTSGTAVAANRRLPSFTFESGPKLEIQEIPTAGYKFLTKHAPGKEWTEGKAKGIPSYDEIVYYLSSLLAYAAPAQQGGTTAYLWTHTPDTDAEDTIKTLTVEQGSAVRAHKFAYGIVNSMSLKFDRSKVESEFGFLGRALSDGITLTSSPTVIAQQPILGKEIDVYADDASGSLGTTKLTRVLSGELTIANRFSPLWTVNTAETSFAVTYETMVEAKLKLLVEADSAGMGLFTTAKAGSTKFMRVKATSATEAGTAYPYSLTFDMAAQVSDVGDFSDSDGIYAIEFTANAVHDETWGKALTVGVVNKRTAL